MTTASVLKKCFCLLLLIFLPAMVFHAGSLAPGASAEQQPTPLGGGSSAETAESAPAESDRSSEDALISMGVVKGERGTKVTISGNTDLSHEHFLIEGKSLILDIYEVNNRIWPTVREVGGKYLRQIRIGEHYEPRKMVRVLFDLDGENEYSVKGTGSQIEVVFGDPSSGKALPPAAGNTVSEVSFTPLDNVSRVEVKSSSSPRYTLADSEDPRRVVVDIADAQAGSDVQKALDLSALDRGVNRVTAFQYERDGTSSVRITVDLAAALPVRVAPSPAGLVIDVDYGGGGASSSMQASPGISHTPPSAPSGYDSPDFSSSPSKVYGGRKVSLDFINADITDILRIVSDVSGVNFVAGDEVKGRVTIKLIDVPWDQALETILKTNNPTLVQLRDAENIIRITTADKVEKEEQKRRRRMEEKNKKLEEERRQVQEQRKLEEEKRRYEEEKRLLGPPVTEVFALSYIDDLHLLRETLTEYLRRDVDPQKSYVYKEAKLLVDNRTHTLVVKDLASNVEEIRRIIELIDTPTPAVMVEARIVEVGSDYAKSLGIQWGGKFSADAAHGNATDFEFPNSINIAGTQGEFGDENFLVDVPASGAVAGFGLSLGHIANTLTLDMRLTAMEQMGHSKIISNPKILVVQNEEAVITVGDKLPIISTIRDDTGEQRTDVTFLDAAIKLEVTPQVTGDGRVFLAIEVAKDSRGETVQTTEGPTFSIDTRSAKTKILIGDGETTVIGGLFQDTEDDVETGVPGLSKIPVLGKLFKSKTRGSVRNELMIFITPRILDLT